MVIYLATNKINNKKYVGQTIRGLDERKSDHKRQAIKQNRRSHFHSAIRKHGFESFNFEVIDHAETRMELSEKEIYWISKYKTTNPKFGYNNTTGGEHYEHTELARKNISISGIGRKMPKHAIEEMRKRNTGKGNPFYGKHHKQDAIEKNRIAHVGKKLTKDHIEKCIHRGESNCRAVITEETARKIKIMLRDGVRNVDIQKTLNVSKSLLQGIKHNKTWAWVKI